MYKITENIYLEKEQYGIINVDYLRSPFLKYVLKNGQPKLLPKLFFLNPMTDTIKVKELCEDSSIYQGIKKEFEKLQ